MHLCKTSLVNHCENWGKKNVDSIDNVNNLFLIFPWRYLAWENGPNKYIFMGLNLVNISKLISC